jgi:GT2 family glycosyltransferase/2-polyprenyl-3-methyl-5-hydroxy-6-metoxy-1,4-benzoquinol methylase
MSLQRVAAVFDRETRPETTGVYCLKALESLCQVEHLAPERLAQLEPGSFDLYLRIDDGLQFDWPKRLRPCACWVIDTHLDYAASLASARSFDLVFAAQRDGAQQLARDGIETAQWLPLACDPAVHRPHSVTKRYDFAFVGNLFPGPRSDLVQALCQSFPNHFVGRAYFQQMAHRYSEARAVFNRSIRNDVNMRVFESVACGSLLLTNDLAGNGQDELFRDRLHLATYQTEEELLDKLRYYLGHESIRERIAAAGRQEAMTRHTYALRMERILATAAEFQSRAQVPVSATTSSARANTCGRKSCQCQESKLPSPGKSLSYFEFARPEVLARIPLSARRVLEVGCGAGRLGEALKARQPAEVTGIEFDSAAAEAARTRLDQVFKGDIERLDPGFAAGAFDCIVCADVLEHLEAPEQLLARIRGWLEPDGLLVASIPNARHHSVVGGLLEGDWTYERAGLLDSTHLRFFTRFDLERMLYRAGFSIRRMGTVPGPGHEAWVAGGRPGQVRLGWLDLIGLPPEEAEEYYVYQYLVDAMPAPMADHELTSIVIVTHNGLEFTRPCIESVKAYTDEPFEFVFIDNGSTDGTLAYLRREPHAALVANVTNRGFPAAVNQGILASRGRQVLLLNNDVVVTTGWLRRLLDALRQEPGAGLVGPLTNWPESPQQIDAGYRDDLLDLDRFAFAWGRAHQAQRIDLGELIGFCLLIDRPVIERIGLMDEEFGIGQCEDKDYSSRAKQAGFRTLLAKDAYVHHFGHRTFLASGIDSAELLRRNLARFRAKGSQRQEVDASIPAIPAVVGALDAENLNTEQSQLVRIL